MNIPIPESTPENKLFDEEKKKTVKAIQKKLSSFEKAIKNAQAQYQSSKEFEEVKHLAELVKANFPLLKRGMTELTVPDWKKDNEEVRISLDPNATPQEMMQDMFVKSQKLKKAITPLQALLKKFDGEVHRWLEALEKARGALDIHQLKDLQKSLNILQEKTAKPKVKALPYHVFQSSSGLNIIVGKNAASNDQVTFQVANGNDLWLHAHTMSGAHVVVRKKKNHDVDPETLHDALQLALYFSKARQSSGSFDVLVSEKKYVMRLPRMPKGKVVVSKHKTMSVTLDKERIEKIKSRSK